MDTTSNNLFSLTQLSKSENTVVFKESNVDDLFQHIKNEPKHGPRVVAFDLDSTLKSHTRDIETLNIIQKLQADRCLVIGLVAKRNMLAVDTTIKEFLALGLNLNQRFFKNTQKFYNNHSITPHVFQDGFLFVSGGPANNKKALNKLIKDFQLNHDDVYFIERSFHLGKKSTHLPFFERQKLNRPLIPKTSPELLPTRSERAVQYNKLFTL